MQQTEMSDAVGVSKTINCKAYADLHPEQKKYIFCHLHLGVAAPILRCLRMYASSLNSVRHVALFYVTIYGRQTLTETINLSYHAQLISRFLSDDCQVLAHLSWKLKWAFLITFRPSSVCSSVRPSVHPSVCKLFTFSSSSPEPLSQFQPNLAQSILGWRGFKFVQMKGPPFSKGR